MGKKIKKAIKRVGKTVRKAVKQVGRPLEKVGKAAIGGLAGGAGGAVEVIQPEPAAPAAALVDVPDKQVETDDAAETESGRRKARAGGKKSLSVARSSGGGINI